MPPPFVILRLSGRACCLLRLMPSPATWRIMRTRWPSTPFASGLQRCPAGIPIRAFRIPPNRPWCAKSSRAFAPFTQLRKSAHAPLKSMSSSRSTNGWMWLSATLNAPMTDWRCFATPATAVCCCWGFGVDFAQMSWSACVWRTWKSRLAKDCRATWVVAKATGKCWVASTNAQPCPACAL